MEHATEDLIYEVRNGIGWITFNRPKARNAFTFAMYEAVAEIKPECGRVKRWPQRDVRCRGQGICGGTDIGQFRIFPPLKMPFPMKRTATG